jgi:hypothetical protein
MRGRAKRDDAGRVEGVNRIIAALDMVQTEAVAKSRNRDRTGETGAHIRVIGQMIDKCGAQGAAGGEGWAAGRY